MVKPKYSFQGKFNNLLTAGDGEAPSPIVPVSLGFSENWGSKAMGASRHLLVRHISNLICRAAMIKTDPLKPMAFFPWLVQPTLSRRP